MLLREEETLCLPEEGPVGPVGSSCKLLYPETLRRLKSGASPSPGFPDGPASAHPGSSCCGQYLYVCPSCLNWSNFFWTSQLRPRPFHYECDVFVCDHDDNFCCRIWNEHWMFWFLNKVTYHCKFINFMIPYSSYCFFF